MENNNKITNSPMQLEVYRQLLTKLQGHMILYAIILSYLV